jgi:hypothetical protein
VSMKAITPREVLKCDYCGRTSKRSVILNWITNTPGLPTIRACLWHVARAQREMNAAEKAAERLSYLSAEHECIARPRVAQSTVGPLADVLSLHRTAEALRQH